MKKVRRIIIVLLILFIGICIINAQTDFFLNIGNYFPVLEEKFPQVVHGISNLSEGLSSLTDYIPSPSEIIAKIKNEEMPIDPSDVAVNAYISNSPMLTFYPKENISVMVDFDEVKIFGIVSSKSKSNLIVSFTDENGEEVEQEAISADSKNEFNKKIEIPKTDGLTLDLDVFTGSKPYGQFESWVYNYVKLVKTPDGGWEIEQSPVYEHNKSMYEKDKSISEALKSTTSIQSSNSNVISIAKQLTDDKETDYDKVLALHDWVCTYLYYDEDSLNSDTVPPYYPTDILKTRKAVCRGYATLMASLCRSINIPCNVVYGYALGNVSADMNAEWTDETASTEEQNHAWNEVYVDGRWMIVDTTWDCKNRIENGEMISEGEVAHLYFDANLQFFSNNHKILEYMRKG
jgi:hypothetical protein